ncbi:ParA family protein, partial [Streptomyces sp. NPDC057413]|uniref:ParA family protein n=1 Tax=Streptomyces sp. NPDC057413 TaxID=3346124 RepID=UPI003682453E
MFNNKGGVSKTTTCFNLSWMLAERGKTVIMVDADPQCNLTGMGSDAGSGDRFGHAAWRAGVVMTVSNSMGVSRP